MQKKKYPHKYKKRYILLLEILIALTLIVLCALPLISPHIMLHRSQREFSNSLELDRIVSNIYSDFLERLHKMDQGLWQSLKEERVVTMDTHFLEKYGISRNFPYVGQYQFQEVISKFNSESGWEVSHSKLIFTFSPKSEKEEKAKKTDLIFPYEFVFLAKNTQQSDEAEDEDQDE